MTTVPVLVLVMALGLLKPLAVQKPPPEPPVDGNQAAKPPPTLVKTVPVAAAPSETFKPPKRVVRPATEKPLKTPKAPLFSWVTVPVLTGASQPGEPATQVGGAEAGACQSAKAGVTASDQTAKKRKKI
jgi:hypothetical protein